MTRFAKPDVATLLVDLKQLRKLEAARFGIFSKQPRVVKSPH
jgi:hypothetical protein